ncbi:MAG TPA: hypothetical protein VE197_22955 [Mycobacterium sp.]|nr:hypothetical protein [Mycobacterium sp.]
MTGVAFSPDGHRIASGKADKTVRLWNTDTQEAIGAPLTGHRSKVLSVAAFSPDAHHIVSGSADNTRGCGRSARTREVAKAVVPRSLPPHDRRRVERVSLGLTPDLRQGALPGASAGPSGAAN